MRPTCDSVGLSHTSPAVSNPTTAKSATRPKVPHGHVRPPGPAVLASPARCHCFRLPNWIFLNDWPAPCRRPAWPRGDATDLATRPNIKFTESHDAPSFCLIKDICRLAFRDRAFASEWIREPKDPYGIKISHRLKSAPASMPAGWQKVPVLRRSVRDSTGKMQTSLTLAAQYNQMATQNRCLRKPFGMEENFESKMLRRIVAIVF